MRIHLIVSLALLLFSVVASAQITVNTNFDPRTNQPIDIRDTLTFLADTSAVTWTYPGLITYAADVDQFWYYNGSFWERVVQDPYLANLQDVDTTGIQIDDIAQWDGSNWIMTSPADVVAAGSDSTNSIYNLLPTQDILIDPNANDLIIGSFGAGNSGDFEFFTTNENGQYVGIFAGTRDSSWLATGEGFQFDAALFSTGAEDGIMGVNYNYFGTVWNAATFGDSILFAPYPGSELNMTINGLPDDPVNPYKVMVQDTVTDRVYLTSIDSLLGSGTAGTLPIWNADGTLGNSSLTESGGNVVGTSFTGAFKLATGTDAQRPVGANGRIRYNSTANGVEAWNGSEAAWRYFLWADISAYSNRRIPFSDGTKLTSSSALRFETDGLYVNTNLRLQPPGIIAFNSPTDYPRITGSSIESIEKLKIHTGTAQIAFYQTTSKFATIGISDYRDKESTNKAALTINWISSHGANPLFITATRASSFSAQDVIIEGGATNDTGRGDVEIRGGGMSNNYPGTGGRTGDIIFKIYDWNGTGGAGINDSLVTMMQIFGGAGRSGPYAKRKIALYQLDQTPGEATDRILTMQDDTIKYRVFAYGEMYIDDTDPDTIAITSGTPAEGTDWLQGELSSFTYSAGRLTYTGTETAKFHIVWNSSASHTVNATNIEAWLYKNNAEVSKSHSISTVITAGNVVNIGKSAIVELATNDYIELFYDASNAGDVIVYTSLISLEKI